MTYEEMLAIAELVASTLNKTGVASNAEVLKDSAKPGQPIPIAFDHDGMDFTLALDVL